MYMRGFLIRMTTCADCKKNVGTYVFVCMSPSPVARWAHCSCYRGWGLSVCVYVCVYVCVFLSPAARWARCSCYRGWCLSRAPPPDRRFLRTPPGGSPRRRIYTSDPAARPPPTPAQTDHKHGQIKSTRKEGQYRYSMYMWIDWHTSKTLPHFYLRYHWTIELLVKQGADQSQDSWVLCSGLSTKTISGFW